MLNYIAIGVVKYLQGGPWEKIPKGTQMIERFSQTARMPNIWGITVGGFIVLALVIFMFCYLRYTKHGYQIAVVGESEATARYAGIPVGRVIVRTMFVSGAVAGIVGFTWSPASIIPCRTLWPAGVGFTGITVAWLAQLNPVGMVFISLLLAVLTKGASTINTLTHNALPGIHE